MRKMRALTGRLLTHKILLSDLKPRHRGMLGQPQLKVFVQGLKNEEQWNFVVFGTVRSKQCVSGHFILTLKIDKAANMSRFCAT